VNNDQRKRLAAELIAGGMTVFSKEYEGHLVIVALPGGNSGWRDQAQVDRVFREIGADLHRMTDGMAAGEAMADVAGLKQPGGAA
jgi:hypothetical protein